MLFGCIFTRKKIHFKGSRVRIPPGTRIVNFFLKWSELANFWCERVLCIGEHKFSTACKNIYFSESQKQKTDLVQILKFSRWPLRIIIFLVMGRAQKNNIFSWKKMKISEVCPFDLGPVALPPYDVVLSLLSKLAVVKSKIQNKAQFSPSSMSVLPSFTPKPEGEALSGAR